MIEDSVAIIPARGGSKGIIDKNIRHLQGHPLLAYSIAVAKLAGFKKILVSTDSEEYAEVSIQYGAEVPFLRPADISLDNSTDFEWMRHAMEWTMDNYEGNRIPEFWFHLRPTTPLREPETLQRAIEIISENPQATSLRSGHEASESPFKWFLVDEKGYFKGLTDDLTPEKVNQPRQMFPKMYIPDGYVDIVRSSYVLENDTLHGDNMLVFISPRCTEVDTEEDFEYLEYEIERNLSPLKGWLDQQSPLK